jgi:hypothetical protein
MKPRLSYPIGCLLLALLTLLLVMAGCTSSRKPSGTPVVPAILRSEYAGAEACTKCHALESEGFSQTNHARTLRPMNSSALGAQTPPVGPLPDTGCVLELANDRYQVRIPSTGEVKTLDYAIGSGKSGMTYVTVENKTTLIEMRRSYFPSLHRWFITPGQEAQEKEPAHIGRNHGNLRACLLCHAVTLPPDSLHPEPKFMGVGCEVCHGPGSAHASSLTQGKMDSSMERLKGANGERINTLCGRCHRTVEDVLAKPVFDQNTARFPVYGLASSRCYQASGGTLTCITCHNPHRNASKDSRSYEAVCLKCHSASRPTPSGATQGKVCPVNPNTGCVGCHMPRKKVFTDTSIPSAMADHLIKVHRK